MFRNFFTFFARSPMLSVLSVAAICSIQAVGGELIPADRRTDWIPGITVGVPGGIPHRTHLIDVTEPPYNADNTGTTDAALAIQAAVKAAKANDVVYLPAGTYRFNSGVAAKSYITIRGAGTNTIVKTYGGARAFDLASSANTEYRPTKIPDQVTRGSTNIMVADAPWYPVGTMIHLAIPDDTNIVNVFGYKNNRKQKARITAISGNRLTIWPPLYDDYPAGIAIKFSQFQVNSAGLEDLVIDAENSTQVFSVNFGQAYGCWAKNIQVKNSVNYAIFISDSLFCEIRDCTLGPQPSGGSNRAGLLHNAASGNLIENNIMIKCYPPIEVNQGSSGNVFAYNYATEGRIFSNHGPQNHLNLYEGNIAPNLQSDGYFGGASKDTLFRNWFTGNENGKRTFTLSLNRFTRDYSVIGNILGSPDFEYPNSGVSMGNPNIGNSSFSGYGPPWNNSLRSYSNTITINNGIAKSSEPVFVPEDADRAISYTTAYAWIAAYSNATTLILKDNRLSLTNSGFAIVPGPAGYQEMDTNVMSTTILMGNYNYHDKAIPSLQRLAGDTLPVSLYRTAKPTWFGNLSWPPFDAVNPAPSLDAIPAGYRYLNGTNPPGVTAPGPGPTAPSNLKILPN